VRSWHGRAAYEGKGLADDDVGERVGKAFVQGRSCRVGMPRVLQADEDLDTRAPGPSGPEPRLYRRTETDAPRVQDAGHHLGHGIENRVRLSMDHRGTPNRLARLVGQRGRVLACFPRAAEYLFGFRS